MTYKNDQTAFMGLTMIKKSCIRCLNRIQDVTLWIGMENACRTAYSSPGTLGRD